MGVANFPKVKALNGIRYAGASMFFNKKIVTRILYYIL